MQFRFRLGAAPNMAIGHKTSLRFTLCVTDTFCNQRIYVLISKNNSVTERNQYYFSLLTILAKNRNIPSNRKLYAG